MMHMISVLFEVRYSEKKETQVYKYCINYMTGMWE